jgi:hypothetical protein
MMLGEQVKNGSRDITNLSHRGQPRTTTIKFNEQKAVAFITAD